MRSRVIGLVAAALLAAAGASAQVEETFSRYLHIFRPDGEFAARLIKLNPPRGEGWKPVEVRAAKFKLAVPGDAVVDTGKSESRVLRVTLPGGTGKPQPVLRVDTFTPGKDDPKEIDQAYATRYADEYSQAAFEGKFAVTDRGYVVTEKKASFALVGGSYTQGAATVHRVQWAYLDRDTQLFVTFDCADGEWSRYEDTVGEMLLSLEMERSRRK